MDPTHLSLTRRIEELEDRVKHIAAVLDLFLDTVRVDTVSHIERKGLVNISLDRPVLEDLP